MISRPRLRPFLFPLLSVFLVLALLVLFLEAGLRVYGSVQSSRAEENLKNAEQRALEAGANTVWMGFMIRAVNNPTIIYALRPHLNIHFKGKALSTGPRGFRREPASFEKAPGVVRIVGLGDSEMFGWGVEEAESYLARLEDHLNRKYPNVKWEVVNTAVPGYNAVMELETLKEVGLKYHPDLVLMHFVRNDFDLPNFIAVRKDPWDWRRSFLFDFILKRGLSVAEFFAPKLVNSPAHPLYKNAFENEADKVPPAYRHLVGTDAYRRAMRELSRLAEERHFRCFVFTYQRAWPQVKSSWLENGLPYVEIEESPIVQDFMRANGIEKFRGSILSLSFEDPHPSRRGHELIFRVLADALEKNGMIHSMASGSSR